MISGSKPCSPSGRAVLETGTIYGPKWKKISNTPFFEAFSSSLRASQKCSFLEDLLWPMFKIALFQKVKHSSAPKNLKKSTFSSKKQKSWLFCVFWWTKRCPGSLKPDFSKFWKHDLPWIEAIETAKSFKKRTFRDEC